MCLVIVGKCTVKRVLQRGKLYRNIIAAADGIRVVKAAVAFGPLFVPRACTIRDEIISSWLFANPKDCRHDICFPAKRSGGRRFSDADLILFSARAGLSKRRLKR